jgi:uncharacterized SAM-binding protein YcdF (DUF218 family)
MVLLSALFSAVLLSPLLFAMSSAAGIGLLLARKRRAAVVVLGGGAVDGVPDESGAAGLSPTSLKRVVRGYVLSRQTGAPLILSGGRTWGTERAEPEAEVGARTLASMGMPGAGVIKEGSSRTTWENARAVAKIVAERGATRVVLVTSAWHMPRAMLAFRKAGVECVPAATDYTFGDRPLDARDFLPSFETAGSCFRALREYVGIVQYAMRR